MSPNRPFVVSIAGFDPTGAGVLTDIKTFEQHRVYGFAITTANTIQTENHYPFNGLILLLYCVLSKNYSKLSHKSSENWYCSPLAYLQRNSVSTKRLSPKQALFGTPF
jgi:hydroxymethylpyrimidine/phosphomethylpyrimidine kinase